MSNIIDINKGSKTKDTTNTHSYNIIDIRWFPINQIGIEHSDPIGIVLVEDPVMHYTFAVMGTHSDPQQIAAWGNKLDHSMAEGVFGYELPNYKKR